MVALLRGIKCPLNFSLTKNSRNTEKYREKQRQAEQLKRRQANDQSDIELMLEIDRQVDEMYKKA